MKSWITCFSVILFFSGCSEPSSSGSGPSSSDPYPMEFTLTDNQGRKLPADILGKSGDQLFLRRKSDQSEFVLPLSKLSEEDQRFLTALPDSDGREASEMNRAKNLAGRNAVWHRDINNAMREAGQLDLPILLVFQKTANSSSESFDKNVLKTDAFRAWANQNAVLCLYYNDSSKSNEGLNSIGSQEGRKLAADYKAGSKSPATVILSPTGKKLARISGYDGGGFTNYRERIAKYFK